MSSFSHVICHQYLRGGPWCIFFFFQDIILSQDSFYLSHWKSPFFFFYIIFHSSHFRGPKGSVLLCLFFLFFLIQSRRLNSISQNPRPHITISNLFSTLDRSRLCSQLNYLKIRPLWFILTALIAIDFTKIKTRIFKVQGLYECLDQKLLTRALNNPTLSQGSHIRNPTN